MTGRDRGEALALLFLRDRQQGQSCPLSAHSLHVFYLYWLHIQRDPMEISQFHSFPWCIPPPCRELKSWPACIFEWLLTIPTSGGLVLTGLVLIVLILISTISTARIVRLMTSSTTTTTCCSSCSSTSSVIAVFGLIWHLDWRWSMTKRDWDRGLRPVKEEFGSKLKEWMSCEGEEVKRKDKRTKGRRGYEFGDKLLFNVIEWDEVSLIAFGFLFLIWIPFQRE